MKRFAILAALMLPVPGLAQDDMSPEIFNACIAGLGAKADVEAQLVADGWTLLTEEGPRAEAIEVLAEGFLPVVLREATTTQERLAGKDQAIAFWQSRTEGGRLLAAQGDVRLFVGASGQGTLVRIECWAAGPVVPSVSMLLDQNGGVPVENEMMLSQGGDNLNDGPGTNVIVMRQMGGEDAGLAAREGMLVTNVFEVGG